MIEKIDLDLSPSEFEEFENTVEDLDFINASEFFTACASVLIAGNDLNVCVETWIEQLKTLAENIRTGRKIFFEILEDNAFDILAEYGVKYVQVRKLPMLAKIFTDKCSHELDKKIRTHQLR